MRSLKKKHPYKVTPPPTPPPAVERESAQPTHAHAAAAREGLALDQEVRSLYADETGALPDLTHLERIRSHHARNVLIGLTVFFGLLASVAWAGFFVFQPYGKAPTEAVRLHVAVPESVRSGERITIHLQYAVDKTVALERLELSATLPPWFLYRASTPEETSQHQWVLGAVPAGGSGDIAIDGVVIGAPGTVLAFQAFSTYVPVNFQSPFQSIASAALPIAGSLLSVTASSTDRVLPGEQVAVSFSYGNDGAETLPSTAFRVTVPPSFVVSKTTPQPTEGSLFWFLGDLAPAATGTITLVGSFSSDTKGPQAFVGAGVLKGQDATFVDQTSTSSTTAVIGGDLVLSTIVNGSQDATALNFGDTIHATVSYANRSEGTLQDVSLVAHLAGIPAAKYATNVSPALDAPSLVDTGRGVFSTSTSSITWTKKEIPALAELTPGEEGSIDVSVRIAPKPTVPGVKEYGVDLWLAGTVGKVNGVKKNRQVQSATMHFPVLSDTRFTAASRYYNDDEITVGTGPLPPKAGAETTYRIFWTIENGLHELRDLSLQTTLPANVRFTGKQDVSAGTVVFDEQTRVVTWTLNKLPVDVQKATVDFEVGLTPSATAVGNILPLTDVTHFDAIDSVVGAHVLRSEDPVDTSLISDPLGRGKGVVTK